MTVLAAMQSAAVRLMGRKPATFFGSSEQFEVEICDLVNEVAADVAKYQDWQALVRIGTVTGDSSQTVFALPNDYDRMLLSTAVQDLSSWAWGFRYVPDLNGFLQSEARGWAPHPGGWTIYGGQLRFSPAPSSGQAATFPYISNQWAIGEEELKPAFTDDADTFALPERLLTLGLVWRWRENKGLDATGDQEAFIKALDEYAAKDKGARTYRENARRSFSGTHVAWPWELG